MYRHICIHMYTYMYTYVYIYGLFCADYGYDQGPAHDNA